MQRETRDWGEGLATIAGERRRAHPMRQAESPAAEAAERAILATHLVSWLDDWSALMEARRRLVAEEPGAGRASEPVVVLTTSAVGIEAAEALLAGGHPVAAAEAGRIVAVTELEYRLWCIRNPDDDHRRHVTHWSWIKTRVPPQRQAEFARYPLGPGESYWLHRTGTAGAGAADRRDCHLWRWTGRQAALLQAFVREGGVSHFAPAQRQHDGD